MAEYFFDNLNPTSFQRLVNAVLAARFGEELRVMPLRGRDGGRDAEALVEHDPVITFTASIPTEKIDVVGRLKPGRHVFQVKFHRMLDSPPHTVRRAVVSDLVREVTTNVIPLDLAKRPDYFVLITNVPSSKESVDLLDEKITSLSSDLEGLHISVWWRDDLVARLDQLPSIWSSFPELFAGNVVPLLGRIPSEEDTVSRTFKIALSTQYERDEYVRFRQVELRNALSSLFIDVPLYRDTQYLLSDLLHTSFVFTPTSINPLGKPVRTALQLLISEDTASKRILLEGGPGQGKSTVTQMGSQIMRAAVLGWRILDPEGRWKPPTRIRLPFRIELRSLSEWLSSETNGEVEGFLARLISQDSGGRVVTVEDLHSAMEKNPTLLIFDGFDEIGTNEQRDRTLQSIADFLTRVESGLQSDIRTIITTRPPAMTGRRDRIPGFISFSIGPLTDQKVSDYLERWLQVQCEETSERLTVQAAFESRRAEPHVAALSRNPMQLSVLLHFIRMKGEAFPDKRAELYREYFKTVIDRDVEKSVRLRQHRDSIEILHQLIGFKLHMLIEAGASDGTLSRRDLLHMVQDWLREQETDKVSAEELFAVGEERLGLITAVRGVGEATQYGYQIQPIREYFAAAFVNEQIQGNAHEVFTALVRRSYWREVAVFLAGLRRPNERADLLSRAKDLDQDEVLGWREEGRNIILQLLTEGVLAQPGYVYTDGVTFGLSGIDPREPAARYRSRDFVSTLIKLCKAGDVQRHRKQLQEMLDQSARVKHFETPGMGIY